MEWGRRVTEYQTLAEELHTVMFGTSGSYRRPLPGATLEEVISLEQNLGLLLDEDHKAFLLAANGWQEFSGTISLLGTADYKNSEMYLRGVQNLGYISNAALAEFKSKRKKLLIVGVSDATLDVICMPFANGQVQKTTVWLNNVEPDVYPTFSSFFEMMRSSTPKAIEHFSKKNRHEP